MILTQSVCCYLTQDKTRIFVFWEGFFDGKVRLEGFTKNLNITLVGSTEMGTSIKIHGQKTMVYRIFLC